MLVQLKIFFTNAGGFQIGVPGGFQFYAEPEHGAPAPATPEDSYDPYAPLGEKYFIVYNYIFSYKLIFIFSEKIKFFQIRRRGEDARREAAGEEEEVHVVLLLLSVSFRKIMFLGTIKMG